jgi:hypothetical protein
MIFYCQLIAQLCNQQLNIVGIVGIAIVVNLIGSGCDLSLQRLHRLNATKQQ